MKAFSNVLEVADWRGESYLLARIKVIAGQLPRTSVMLAILAFALYVPGFWWGSPHATAADRKHSWGVDDETPLGPLTEIHSIIHPKTDRNLGYPLMYSFIVVAAYTPYVGYLLWMGGLTSISATYPFGLTDPVGTLKTLTMIAHLVSVLMGVGIVVAAYAAGRTLWGSTTGMLSGLFAMVAYPMFYYARTGNVDVSVLFFTALALAAFARILVKGLSVKRTVWLGVFVGFALATKEPSIASFLAFPFVLLILNRRQNAADGWLSWSFWKIPLAGVAVTFLAFGVGSGLFVNPERYFAHLQFVAQRSEMMRAGLITFQRHFPNSLDGHFQLAGLVGKYLVDAMTVPGLLLALLGVIWTLCRERRSAIFLLPAVTYLLVLFFFGRAAQLRYVMPVAFTLSFFAARSVAVAWESHKRPVLVIVLLLATIAIGLNLMRGIDLTYAMINDSRYEAAVWLDAHAEGGDHVEYFGYADHLPPLKAGVITEPVVEFQGVFQRPRFDDAAVQEIRQRWLERKPQLVIIVPDFTSAPGVPYSANCPPKVYEGLHDGTLGYQLAASFQTPSILPWVKRPDLDYQTVNPRVQIFVPTGLEIGK